MKDGTPSKLTRRAAPALTPVLTNALYAAVGPAYGVTLLAVGDLRPREEEDIASPTSSDQRVETADGLTEARLREHCQESEPTAW
jgi:hypothetical protein